MRIISLFIVMTLGLITRIRAEPQFTNCVAIKDSLHLSVTDYREEGGGIDEMLYDRSLEADVPLQVLVHNKGSVKRTLWVFNRFAYYFSFDLYDDRTNLVKKTALGLKDSLVPPSTFTSTIKVPIRYIPSTPGSLVILRELPPLEEYFQIKKPGNYVLELRLRYCAQTNGVYSWKYSDQIRLPVVYAP